MAKKRKGDHHFSGRGPRYEIDTGFGGFDSKYSKASIPEGIELLKGDLKDLAAKYWRSTQKEENQYFKYPPLPPALLRFLAIIYPCFVLKVPCRFVHRPLFQVVF